MRFLSWDIGIKNLAFCLLEYKNDTSQIIDWDVINLFEEKPKEIEFPCISYQKNGNKCSRKSVKYDSVSFQCYCKVHSKNIPEKMLLEVKNITCCHILKTKKTRCQKKIKYVTDNPFIGYCETHKNHGDINNLSLISKPKKIKNDLSDISERLILELDNRKHFLDVDYILIENQPAFKNPKMKSIQMIVYTYFLIRSKIDLEKKNQKILFLMASNKLKVNLQTEEDKNSIIQNIHYKYKDKYKRHKELAKSYCQYFLDLYLDEKWLQEYNNHKKKDDMADTYLMNIYQIQKVNQQE